jgi:hypothetical protein
VRVLPLLLVAAAAAGAPETSDFELSPPAGNDWEVRTPDRADVKALYRTEFADTNPKAWAEVRVILAPLAKNLDGKGLDGIARAWAESLEGTFPDVRRVDEGKAALGGEEAWYRDVRNDFARLTWHLVRRGTTVYLFHVLRTNEAVDDARVEEEIAGMRASFRFLAPVAPEPPPRPPEPPPAKVEPRATLTLDFWRLEYVKPEGLVRVPPEELDETEEKSGVVAKLRGTGDQTLILVRIYAQSGRGQKATIDELAEEKIRRFRERYDEAHRHAVRRDPAWKPPLAERTIGLELIGRGRTTEITRWYLAQCRNDRQYQVEILVAGDPERWSAAIRDLLDGFRPLRD